MSRASDPRAADELDPKAPLQRATLAQLGSKRFRKERAKQIQALPTRREVRRNERTGAEENVRVVLCPPACGEYGTCPVEQPYYPCEALDAAQERHSIWEHLVSITDEDALWYDPFADDDAPRLELRPYRGPKRAIGA